MTATKGLTMNIRVEVAPEHVAAFEEAMTGNDDDIVLAAEKAMRERIGSLAADIELWPDDPKRY